MTDKVEANHLPDILWRDEGMDTGTGLVTGMAMEDGDEEAPDTEKVESMVGVTSLYLEESHHHGVLLPSVHVETTISEMEWSLGMYWMGCAQEILVLERGPQLEGGI